MAQTKKNTIEQAQTLAIDIINDILNKTTTDSGDRDTANDRQLTTIGTATTVFMSTNKDTGADTIVILNTSASDFSVKEYRIPTGATITDRAALAQALATCIDTCNFFSVKDRAARLVSDKTADDLTGQAKEQFTFLMGVLRDIFVEQAYDMTAIHPVTAVLAYTMTGHNNLPLHKTDSAKELRKAIEQADRAAANVALCKMIDLRGIPFMKSIKSRLSVEEVNNLSKLATATQRKWTATGIQATQAKDKDILRQVLMAVFDTEYNIHFERTQGKAQAHTYSFEQAFAIYSVAGTDGKATSALSADGQYITDAQGTTKKVNNGRK